MDERITSPVNRVQRAQVRHAVAAQDPGHGPCGHPQFWAEPVLAAAVRYPGSHDSSLDLGRSATGLVRGREDRSLNPASPSSSNRVNH